MLLMMLLAIVNGYVPKASLTTYDAVGAFGLTSELTAGNEWFCTATLVTDNRVLVEKHCLTPYGQGADYSVRFRRALDGSLGTIEAGPSSFYHGQIGSFYVPPGGWTAIGYLAHPVHHIVPIPIFFGALSLGAEVTLAGWGREGPGFGEGPKRELMLCVNEVRYVDAGQVNVFSAWDQTGPLCGTNSNDSGGPALLNIGGQLFVVATDEDATAMSALQQYATDPQFSQ